MAVCHRGGSKDEAVIIPAGSVVVSVDPIETRAGFDRSKLIEVTWRGKTILVFLLDLLERGERVEGADS
jgi:hypothetical protein